MTILKMLKTLLGMDILDTSQDDILNYYLQNSKVKIVNYLRITIDFSDVMADSDFEEKYFNPICELAKYDYNNRKAVGVKQYAESKRSVTYRDNSVGESIPQEVKAMLPKPSIVMW